MLWLGHHRLFQRTRYADALVVRLNLLLLMAVSFLPFPTRLMAEALDRTDAERAAVIFYGATLLVVTGLLAWMARHVAAHRDLTVEGAAPELAALAGRAAPSLGFYVLVLLLALFAPEVAAFGFLALAVRALARA